MKLTKGGVVMVTSMLCGCGGESPSSPSTPPLPVAAMPPPSDSALISGTVADLAFRSLAGVRVEVLDGPQAGTSVVTNSRGEFSLTGVFDDETRFQATKDGYAPSIQVLQPFCAACNPHRWVYFSLDVLTGAVDLAGEYLVTLNGACPELPNEMRTRTCTASVSAARQQTIPLSGATFVKGYDALPMGIVSDYVAFWIEVVVEQVAANAYLTVNALAAANVGAVPAATLTFPLDGSIDYCVTSPDTGTYEDCYRNRAVKRVQCPSGQLVFTRR
jgi:Carboxypeptidase regulatory-like domain